MLFLYILLAAIASQNIFSGCAENVQINHENMAMYEEGLDAVSFYLQICDNKKTFRSISNAKEQSDLATFFEKDMPDTSAEHLEKVSKEIEAEYNINQLKDHLLEIKNNGQVHHEDTNTYAKKLFQKIHQQGLTSSKEIQQKMYEIITLLTAAPNETKPTKNIATTKQA